MKEICYKFSSKINININSLYFIYNGNQINENLTFKEQANSLDNNRNQMNILVFKHEVDGLRCQKCGEIINLSILDDIINNNKNQKDIFIELKNQIDNIINLYDINDIKRKIKLTKIIIEKLISENEKNFITLQNISNDNSMGNNDLNLLNQKQYNNNFELLSVYKFEPSEQNILKNFILKSVSKNDNYEIAKCIHEDCKNWNEGYWIISVGEKNKFSCTTNSEKGFACKIGTYKIIIDYCCS